MYSPQLDAFVKAAEYHPQKNHPPRPVHFGQRALS